ncbi:hypothetical protein BO70DRAFT_367158 [Aspergillus heteromorphus CBS 117.55]|uniref:Ubiquitin-like domain-containing protein n=1 Tax=Aspergillus heteromorphus CBS 117.55 TaxID=1448321 RepID=A0A317UNJ2_9EURO|nr:uncharacterized protein BO70DRAFT_367158 [Aspergillus heteromorphus CBS 117.55]PWY63553.1 hypothetical protein BO70DRAFT_367158 [Aspergillus heteromorphus CBS 117.55]
MRSFFNKPSWASRGDEEADLDFYRRAGQVYNDIVTTNTRAHSARFIGNNGSTKRRRFEQTPEASGPGTEPCNNHQISNTQDRALNSGTSCSSSLQEDVNKSDCQPPGMEDTGKPNTAKIIETSMQTRALVENVRSTEEDTVTISPWPMERGEEKKVQIAGNPNAKHARTDPDIVMPDKSNHRDNDAVVQILITSKIANTKPLIVRRKLHQPLKDVRLAWCHRQSLSREIQASIFLTWKGKRLFDVTTCRSLGIHTRDGKVVSTKDYKSFLVDDEELQLHMEAATDEIFNLNNRQLSLATNKGSLSEAADLLAESFDLDTLVLKSPGVHDLKVHFSLQMRVSQLITAFRIKRHIPAECDVYLLFDGDRLDPSSTLASYDLMNNDLVDVIVKREA